MFDIGFWEMMLVGVIGLIVLGPERLPTAIRSVMRWINSAKKLVNSVKNDISQELKLHEMNENMIKATKQGFDELDPDLKKSIEEMRSIAKEVTKPYKDTVQTSNNEETQQETTAHTTQTKDTAEKDVIR
ncbi:twin-arginine translocation protein subunit TatB [Psychromonas sp. CNPT3]|uniref:Sec-independent protein translocase protein TatB n=1 Tax=Psychromonas sp. CNPT3 TaxID=314282 RepID=UPI00006E5833|nr:Sec-independent protein translocase protein TatB [Psychromonas sp. CNPT3]AGH80456.1 twin-arginine translocation protein subunit TatB [Psychromonas sp. CNPT3]